MEKFIKGVQNARQLVIECHREKKSLDEEPKNKKKLLALMKKCSYREGYFMLERLFLDKSDWVSLQA